MKYKRQVERLIEEIRADIGSDRAINALSGGIDSSVLTALAHRALGKQLTTVFVDNGLMRKGEAAFVARMFRGLQIPVRRIKAKKEFLDALAGKTDPEEKRHAVTDTFYANVFSRLVRESGAKVLLHGTILTDIEETTAGIKRQHNILSQLGINPEKEYGYRVIEPLCRLRKDGVRKLATALALPDELATRIPFPGPALATRIIGEVTEERLRTARAATAIVEEELAESNAFQYLAVLFQDRATGIRRGRREFGQIVAVRCIRSRDARTAAAVRVPWPTLERICKRITAIPGVNRCLYDLTPKPPATVEYI